jgi:hypothetical protein
MAVNRRGSLLTFSTPAGRCHFLESDNLCRIEKEHGKALKPGVCMLFPFNTFTRIGNTIAVSPHFMCPLRLQVPVRPGEVAGSHATIKAAVHESGLADRAYVKQHLPPARLHPSEPARSVLRREARFRDACARALGRHCFSDVLRSTSVDADRLDAWGTRAAPLLGLTTPSRPLVRDFVDDLLLALAPSLRLGYLQLPAEGILLALALGELVLRRALTLSNGPTSPQGAYQIVTSLRPALHLLAWADEPVELAESPAPKVPPFGDPQMTFAAYRVLRAATGSTGALAVLEQAIDGSLSVADRTALLMELGGYLRPAGTSQQPKRQTTASAAF